MQKKEVQTQLNQIKAEIGKLEELHGELEAKMSETTRQLAELRTVARYLSRQTGEEGVASETSASLNGLTIGNAAARVVGVGEEMRTTEIADRLLKQGLSYSGNAGQLAGTLGTILARHAGFRRIGLGRWVRLGESKKQ
jgi:hypothetical protein